MVEERTFGHFFGSGLDLNPLFEHSGPFDQFTDWESS